MSRSNWIALLHRLSPDPRARTLWFAFALLLLALAMPRVPLPRHTVDQIVVFDITQSMDVPDQGLDGHSVSRLRFARESVRRALPDLPCGSKVGWAVFAEYRTLLLMAPIEVCENHAELVAALERIDGTMRWSNASEITKGVFWAMRTARDTAAGGAVQVVFMTDGHEAPPLGARTLRLFDDLHPGEQPGWLVGVGGDTPQPIPRADKFGRPIGLWRADEVVQQPGTSSEHLSALHEAHLEALARQVGFRYARLRSLESIRPVLHDPRAAQRVMVPTDVSPLPVATALLLLAFNFMPARLGARGRAAAVALVALFSGAAARADEAAVTAQRLAPGVYHVAGHIAPWGPQFAGRVANSGFVIGERCIAVIDAGGSPTAARALLAAIRGISELPLCYVIATHVHPDHVMGTDALADANASGGGPQLVGHARLAASLAARAPYYLRAMQRDFAAADIARGVAAPAIAVQDRLELNLGGRTLTLRAWPTAHTDSDLTVLDRASGTLWLGDLAFVGHLPVLDGKLLGWRGVLHELRAVQAKRAVPGHGPPIDDWPAGLQPTEAYLAQLERDVRQAVRDGLSLSEAVARLGDAAPDGWLLTQEFHRRNVTAAYAELEWAR
ncbi:MAG TPA: quinoprotein relay system zinc metallohydrolase 2 [Burkholderiaceae bacterium]|nr:quinoprotein relay system zinc metallohydrolase 2 [Burkholderiaceae bacterium]